MIRKNLRLRAVTPIVSAASRSETRLYLALTVLMAFLFCSTVSTQAQACTTAWSGQTGVASYYGPGLQGNRTASGEVFDMWAMTAAHPCLPMGTKIRVTLVDTGRSLVVTVNDRLPSRRRVLDLSMGAARQLGMVGQGIAMVQLTPAG